MLPDNLGYLFDSGLALRRLLAPENPGLRGVVFLREPLGLEDEVLVEVAGMARIEAVTASSLHFPEGAALVLECAPRDTDLFHPESKETLCHGIDAGPR